VEKNHVLMFSSLTWQGQVQAGFAGALQGGETRVRCRLGAGVMQVWACAVVR